MKKFLLLFLVLFTAIPSLWAYTFQSGDLYYDINADGTSVTVVQQSTYKDLNTITIPETVNYNGKTYSVTAIGNMAFNYCTGLTDIIIPEGVTTIGYYAFYNCTKLRTVDIPKSVTTIGASAFGSCTAIILIYSANPIPIDIPYNTFRGVDEMCILNVPAGSKQSYVDKWGWSKDKVAEVDYGDFVVDGIYYKINEDAVSVSVTYSSGSNYSGDIVIPETVTYNGSVDFYNGNTYTVTNIGSKAFYQCSDLTSITIPETVTSIGDGAFQGCI